jgi:predicted acylesterase/phospholipase RssA
LQENRSRFIKPWKEEYADMSLAQAVQGSCTVPTYFPVVANRYIDGGVGSYANPCYLAAYEAQVCLDWDPAETTLISLGTGRTPHSFKPEEVNKLWAWQWLDPVLGAFLQSADDQQVHLVQTFFNKLDFRRFQVDMEQNIEMDDTSMIPRLAAYGIRLGRKILSDNIDQAQKVMPARLMENEKLPD